MTYLANLRSPIAAADLPILQENEGKVVPVLLVFQKPIWTGVANIIPETAN